MSAAAHPRHDERHVSTTSQQAGRQARGAFLPAAPAPRLRRLSKNSSSSTHAPPFRRADSKGCDDDAEGMPACTQSSRPAGAQVLQPHSQRPKSAGHYPLTQPAASQGTGRMFTGPCCCPWWAALMWDPPSSHQGAHAAAHASMLPRDDSLTWDQPPSLQGTCSMPTHPCCP